MQRFILAASVVAAGAIMAVTSLAAAPGDAPVVSSLAPFMQKEIHWGMNHFDVTETYNKPTGLFDREYAPQLAKLQPGTAMDQLESDRDGRKANFARSYTEFLDSPTGYDVSALQGEYTYNNGEAVQKLVKDGKTRYFFYIKDRLWKTYDEVPLKADGPLGATFQAAVASLGGVAGGAPRMRAADPSQGVDRPTADWQDGSTHLRAVDRSGEHIVGVVLEDKRTLANLGSLREHKAVDPFALDPAIAALTKHGVSDPNAVRQGGGDAGAPRRR